MTMPSARAFDSDSESDRRLVTFQEARDLLKRIESESTCRRTRSQIVTRKLEKSRALLDDADDGFREIQKFSCKIDGAFALEELDHGLDLAKKISMIKDSNKKIGVWINSFISRILKPQSEFFVQVPENLFGLIIGSKRRTLKATIKNSNTTIEIIEGKGFHIRRKTEKNSNAETAARDIMYRVDHRRRLELFKREKRYVLSAAAASRARAKVTLHDSRLQTEVPLSMQDRLQPNWDRLNEYLKKFLRGVKQRELNNAAARNFKFDCLVHIGQIKINHLMNGTKLSQKEAEDKLNAGELQSEFFHLEKVRKVVEKRFRTKLREFDRYDVTVVTPSCNVRRCVVYKPEQREEDIDLGDFHKEGGGYFCARKFPEFTVNIPMPDTGGDCRLILSAAVLDRKEEDAIIINKTEALGEAKTACEFMKTCSSFPSNYLIDYCRKSRYQCYKSGRFEVAVISETQLHSSQERLLSNSEETKCDVYVRNLSVRCEINSHKWHPASLAAEMVDTVEFARDHVLVDLNH
ncbi:uncharacterized protein [Oscarella lobularis]|uniref:uncharacterized protein n=1 Tax=Oscarella lobularis TaxID=121494 RepID=UPI0033140250